MDVNVGDRVTIEATVIYATETSVAIQVCSGDTANVPRSAIKSVEPALPAVGDTVTWDDDSRQWRVVAIDTDEMWVKTGIRNEIGDVVRTDAPSFHIIKRASK